MKSHHILRFGPFSLDPAAKVLLKDGQPVHMTRKAVETLLVLAESPGQVVTKEEIISTVWPDRVVDDANLAQNIAVVRRALGQEHGSPGYIETFAGRGYRLVGPVEAVGDAAAPAAHPAPEATPPPVASRRWPLRFTVVVLAVLLSVAGAWFALRRDTQPSQTAFHIVPMTRLPGKEFQPAIAPDGKRLAFVWTAEGAKPAGIWVQGVDESSPRAVNPKEGLYSSPAWSPDGRSLAYLRLTGTSTDILITDLQKRDERLVTRLSPPDYGTQNRLLDWSPSGDSLVVAHSEAPDRALGLFLVSVSSGQITRLTEPGETVGGDIDPRFSPGGQTVSFIRYIARSHQELFATAIRTGATRQLTSDGKQISGHDWMPDGKSIVLASDRNGEFRLWRIRQDAPEPGKTAASFGIYGEFPIQLSLARKAPSLVYAVLQQDRNIWRLDLDGLRWSRVIASSGQDASPQYSPAGDRICFRSDRSGEDQLWVSNADGSNPVQVTRGSLQPSVGHWSPSGRAIAFNNSRTSETHLAELGPGADWTTRLISASGIHPVFSPDGKWIYAGTRTTIIRIPAAGGASTEVANTRAISLDVSRDGKFIYFVRQPNDRSLWRASTESGQVSSVVDGLIPGCTSCWALAPDGAYYLGGERQSFERQVLYFLEFSTGRERPILEYPEPLWPLGSGPFSLSPDTRHLLLVRVDPSNSDIMRVEPFR